MCLDKVVYRHIRNDSGKVFYVGIGSDKRPYSVLGRNTHWNNVFKKAGCSVEIVADNLSWDDACELEIFLISEYGRKNLTNKTDGGEGGLNPTESTRYKIGSAMRGKKHTKETLEKISKGNKGKTNSKSTIEMMIRNSAVAKSVVDLETGIFYTSLRNACIANNVNYKSEHLRITRYNKNYRFKYLS